MKSALIYLPSMLFRNWNVGPEVFIKQPVLWSQLGNGVFANYMMYTAISLDRYKLLYAHIK